MRLIASIDFGTDKTVAVLAQVGANVCQLKSLKNMTSEGIKSGVVKDFALVEKKVCNMINAMSLTEKIDILRVGLPLNVVNRVKHTVSIYLNQQQITYKTLKDAEQRCLDSVKVKGEQLEVIASTYRLDKNEVHQEILGATGQILEIDYFVYWIDAQYLNNLTGLFSNLDIAEIEFVPSVVAYQNIMPVNDKNELHGVMLDLGADGMTLTLFVDNLLKENVYFPIGGDTIDYDIAKGFGIDINKATILKKEYGQAIRACCKNKKVKIPETSSNIDTRDIATAMQFRLEEMFEGVMYFLVNNKYYHPGLPIYLTGGTSKIIDIDLLLNKMSSHDVRFFKIDSLETTRTDILEKPEYGLVLGLLLCDDFINEADDSSLKNKFFTKLKNFFS